LKSAKSAMTPPEYAACTSTPTIPWIGRGASLWRIVNREEIDRIESASPVWAARLARGARFAEGSNGRSRVHAQALANNYYSARVGVLLGLGSGGSGRYRRPDLRAWRKCRKRWRCRDP